MKTHLTYKIRGEETGAAYCGNNARGYKYGLRTTGARGFRDTPAADRCAHCERIYLENRNAIRRRKGLSPVATPFEGQTTN